MKISPITYANIQTRKINNNNSAYNSIQNINKIDEISFNGLEKFKLYLEACALQKEGKTNLKKADKIVIKAQEFKAQAAKIKQDAQDIKEKIQIQTSGLKSLIANSEFKRDGSSIDNPEIGVKKRTWQRLIDGGICITDERNNGTKRKIFARRTNVTIYEYDKKEQILESYLLNPETLEIEQHGKNLKIVANYIMQDERYTFQNGKLYSFDAAWQSNSELTSEKSMERYEFENNGDLSAYMFNIENIPNQQGRVDELFSFSENGELYDYCERVKHDVDKEKTCAKLRILFEEGEQLALYLVDDKDIEDAGANVKKNFEYTNSILENVYLDSLREGKKMSFKKIYIYDNNKPAYCNINEKYTPYGTTFDKQIKF